MYTTTTILLKKQRAGGIGQKMDGGGHKVRERERNNKNDPSNLNYT